MPTWLDVLVVTLTYSLFGAGLFSFFRACLRPPKFRSTTLLPGLTEGDLTLNTDHWGLY